MWAYGQRFDWVSERSKRYTAVAIAAAVVLCSFGTPNEAHAYRRGLASSIGGATLDQGHAIWLATGYPRTSIGWAMALHPVFDLGVDAEVVYGSPVVLGDSMIGGGGGVHGRVALVRGRLSAALSFGVSAIAFFQGGDSAALIDMGSPSAEISIRFSDRFALHASLRLVLQYITAPVLQYITTPAQFIGGFEGGAGATVALGERLALFFSLDYGTTMWRAQESGTARLDITLGVEYRLGGAPSRSPRPEETQNAM
jgi:hypothetical protein